MCCASDRPCAWHWERGPESGTGNSSQPWHPRETTPTGHIPRLRDQVPWPHSFCGRHPPLPPTLQHPLPTVQRFQLGSLPVIPLSQIRFMREPWLSQCCGTSAGSQRWEYTGFSTSKASKFRKWVPCQGVFQERHTRGEVDSYSIVRVLCMFYACFLCRLQTCKAKATFQSVGLSVSILVGFAEVFFSPEEERLPLPQLRSQVGK